VHELEPELTGEIENAFVPIELTENDARKARVGDELEAAETR
jgi:hypothetical protein